jgi:hypothetical protein
MKKIGSRSMKFIWNSLVSAFFLYGLPFLTYSLSAMAQEPVNVQTTSSSVTKSLPEAPTSWTGEEEPQAGQDSKTHPASQPMLFGAAPKWAGLAAVPVTMTIAQKVAFLGKPAFGPRVLLMTTAPAAIQMAGSRRHYPHEWRAGVGAYGRNYGNDFARNAATSVGSLSVDILLREDPRYTSSESTAVFARIAHALAFTFVNRTDGGRSMPAIANFAGAAAGGYIGNAYLPDGWNDAVHGGQRSELIFAGMAGQNVLKEFAPELGRALKKLHIPSVPLPPVWWTPSR